MYTYIYIFFFSLTLNPIDAGMSEGLGSRVEHRALRTWTLHPAHCSLSDDRGLGFRVWGLGFKLGFRVSRV